MCATPPQVSEDLTLRIWDSRTMIKPAQVFQPKYVYFALAVDVSEDGNTILTSSKGFNSEGCEGRLWDRRKGSMIHRLDGHSQAATACAFLRHGQFAVTGSKDRSIRVWDTVSGHCSSVTPSGMITSMVAAPEESEADLYVSTFDGGMHVYQVDGSGNLKCLATSHPDYAA